MPMIFDDRSHENGTPFRAEGLDPAFNLLGAAMASGLCLDLMIERLLESAAGEAR